MKIYWYAPFDNASETDLAIELTNATSHELVFHSCSHRFGQPLDPNPAGRFSLIRDLPPPAGEMGERRTALRQLQVVVQRTARRRRLVQSSGFDLAHMHTFNLVTDWIAIRRLRRLVPAVVQSVHDIRPQRSRLPRRLETTLLRLGYSQRSALIVAHDHLRQLLVTDFGVDPERVHIVPLPVLPLPGLSAPKPRSIGTPMTVLFFGTFRENKGIPVLLEAIRLLAHRDDLRFIFGGRGDEPLECAVRDAAANDPRIHEEVGYVTDDRRQELLEMSDLVILPYLRFNSQSGVLSRDAYGSRRPVIATRVGALGQAVERDSTGWLIEPGDPVALARAIEHAADSPDDYNDRVARIHEIARTRSMDQIAGKIAAVYDSCGHGSAAGTRLC